MKADLYELRDTWCVNSPVPSEGILVVASSRCRGSVHSPRVFETYTGSLASACTPDTYGFRVGQRSQTTREQASHTAGLDAAHLPVQFVATGPLQTRWTPSPSRPG